MVVDFVLLTDAFVITVDSEMSPMTAQVWLKPTTRVIIFLVSQSTALADITLTRPMSTSSTHEAQGGVVLLDYISAPTAVATGHEIRMVIRKGCHLRVRETHVVTTIVAPTLVATGSYVIMLANI